MLIRGAKGLLPALAFAIAACAPQTVQLKPEVATSFWKAERVIDSAEHCAISIVSVTDARRDPTGFGNFAHLASLDQQNVERWLSSGVMRLNRVADVAPDEVVKVSVELLKLYVNMVGPNFSSTAVLRATINGPAQSSVDLFRGSDFSANWGFAESEVEGTLERALRAAITELAGSVSQQCPTEVTVTRN